MAEEVKLKCDHCLNRYVGEPYPKGWGKLYLSVNHRGSLNSDICPECVERIHVALRPGPPTVTASVKKRFISG